MLIEKEAEGTGTLTFDELLSMTCAIAHRHMIIFARTDSEPVWRIKNCAEAIIRDWNADFARLGTFDEFFLQCDEMYHNWDYAKVTPVSVDFSDPYGDGSIGLTNGHHRSFTLSVLVLQGKIEYQPLPCFSEGEFLIVDPAMMKGNINFYNLTHEIEKGAHLGVDLFVNLHCRHPVHNAFVTLESLADYCLAIRDFSVLAQIHPFFQDFLRMFRSDYLFPADPQFFKKVAWHYGQKTFAVKSPSRKLNFDTLFIDDADRHAAILVSMAYQEALRGELLKILISLE